jgi:RNA polymerase sigma-70 factor (ECF subfamily)
MLSFDATAVSQQAPRLVTDRTVSEQELTARAGKGDVKAFEKLYRDHLGRVYALCLRMSGDPSLAEELTQEAFIRAWSKLTSFRGDSAFSTWLHRLTVNVVLGHGRSRSRRERAQSADESTAKEPQVQPRQPETALDLERAVGTLPRRARTVFVLHDVEGYKHHEIADLTGMAVGTSKAQLHRARRLLRKALS